MNQEQAGAVLIQNESDIIAARKVVRLTAIALGFGLTDVTRIVTAASELARNVFRFVGSGLMRWRRLDAGDQVGIELIFEDRGPGIPDIAQAMQEGYTTGRGLGMGLPGAKRLMDEMAIQSTVGQGTTVTIRKWRRA